MVSWYLFAIFTYMKTCAWSIGKKGDFLRIILTCYFSNANKDILDKWPFCNSCELEGFNPERYGYKLSLRPLHPHPTPTYNFSKLNLLKKLSDLSIQVFIDIHIFIAFQDFLTI